MTKDKNHTEQVMTDFVQWLNTQRDLTVSESFHEIVAHVTALISRAQDVQAVRNAALEEAAQVCNRKAKADRMTKSGRLTAVQCAGLIRLLQSAPAQPVESQDAVELPPLPKPQAVGVWGHMEPKHYTADQMREYALAALSQVAQEEGAREPWEPKFEAIAHDQEQLAIKFCVELAQHRIDAVRMLEMAEALYLAERNDPVVGISAAPQSDAQQSSEKDR